MPIAIFAVVLGHAPLVLVVQAYAILLVGCIAFHALALVISMALGRGVSAVAVLPYLVLVAFTSGDYGGERTPGNLIQSTWTLHQLNPLAAAGIFTNDPPRVPRDLFFNVSVSHFVVLMVIYVTLIAWFSLAVVRNLKRDPAVYELYSPLQAFGLAVYLNVVMLGFFNWKAPLGSPIVVDNQLKGFNTLPPRQVEESLLFGSFWLFALLGIVLLRNRERVRRRIQALRNSAAGFWAAVWPSSFALAGIIVAGLAIVELIRVYRDPTAANWNWSLALLNVLFFALWLARDLLYVQWMGLRRTRRPLGSAILYLIVFYTCTIIILGVAHLSLRPWVGPFSAALIPSTISSLPFASWPANCQPWLVALAVLIAEVALFAFLHRQKLRAFLPPSRATAIPPSAPQIPPITLGRSHGGNILSSS